MTSVQDTSERAAIDVENVGGIERTSVTFTPGVSILTGRNATNRTSLLKAIMAAHGSGRAALKADAESGKVEFATDEETYGVTFEREDGTVTSSGTPYLDDPEVADLFAFLVEDNDARRAVERGDDLRDVLMRPVDTDEIQSQIQMLQDERDEIDDRLDELDALKQRLPDLEAKRSRLEEQIETKESELEQKQAELADADATVDEKREAKDELEAKLDELRTARSNLEDIQYDLTTQRDTLESLRSEKADLESEYEALSETPGGDLEHVEERLEDFHDRKQSITADLNRLQNIIQFNDDLLDDADADLFDVLGNGQSGSGEGSEEGALTDMLVDDEVLVTCWTCGSQVEKSSITEMVDELREFRQRKLEERRELDEEIGDLQEDKRDLETQQRQREQLERSLAEYENRIEETEETISDFESRESDQTERVERLKETVANLEQQEQSDLLDLHREVNQLEFDVERIEDDLQEVESDIEAIEEQLDERASIEERRADVQEELEDLRTTVDRLEQEAIDEFNTHMEILLDELDYENIERVWIERSQRDVREGRRTVSKGTFDLHVVRATDEGRVYEDTVDNLSESEREVVGLVFALSGYLVHDVHESIPFMLLDSLEAIDADRISTLVDYFADYADYLVIALLPEDAAALDDEHTRITDI